MVHQIFDLIATYGVPLVFVNVLVTQLGAPLPAVPTLVVAGAMAAGGQLALPSVLLAALLACLLGDSLWYWAGRRHGGRVMRVLCRVSLSPDSCVRRSEVHFQRWRGQVLLVAKFVPGLSTVAPPLVGAMGLRFSRFVLFDGAGALLWSGLAIALGGVFAAQLDALIGALAGAGLFALQLLLGLLASYVLAKWWQRHRLLAALRMARIAPVELAQALAQEPPPVVIDVRSVAARALDPRIIPRAVLADPDAMDSIMQDIAPDSELVVYCNCPHEASAAKVAKALMDRGYRRVRPLAGGLDGWEAAGYATGWLAAGTGAMAPGTPAAPA